MLENKLSDLINNQKVQLKKILWYTDVWLINIQYQIIYFNAGCLTFTAHLFGGNRPLIVFLAPFSVSWHICVNLFKNK